MSLSQRSQSLVGDTPPLVLAHFKCASDPFNFQQNPEGYINLGTAENFLMEKEVSEKLQEIKNDFSFGFHYDYPQGAESLRKSFQNFAKRFLGIRQLPLTNIVFASGASAILEILSYVLCDPEDEILLMSPLYNGFYHDLEARFKAKIKTSNCLEDNSFDAKIFEKSIQSCHNLKTVLINNPHNPTGYCLNKNEIRQIIQICKKYDLEIISDEIYANSVYGEAIFTSFLDESFAELEYQTKIHGVYGLAKDFCMSGLKVGVFYSFNNQISKAVAALSYFHTVSTQTQVLAKEIFNDLDWCASFFKENQLRLLETYQDIETQMSAIGVKIYPAQAGIFAWADFSGLFEIKSFDQERELTNLILNQFKINLTPGEIFASNRPGMYRICFAKDKKVIQIFLNRMNKLIQGREK